MCHGEESHETRSHDRYGGRRQPIQHSILKVFYHVIGARKSGYRPSLNLSIRMSHEKYAKQLTPYVLRPTLTRQMETAGETLSHKFAVR